MLFELPPFSIDPHIALDIATLIAPPDFRLFVPSSIDLPKTRKGAKARSPVLGPIEIAACFTPPIRMFPVLTS